MQALWRESRARLSWDPASQRGGCPKRHVSRERERSILSVESGLVSPIPSLYSHATRPFRRKRTRRTRAARHLTLRRVGRSTVLYAIPNGFRAFEPSVVGIRVSTPIPKRDGIPKTRPSSHNPNRVQGRTPRDRAKPASVGIPLNFELARDSLGRGHTMALLDT